MAASSFSIWYKFNEKSSSVINSYMLYYNRDGQFLSMYGNVSTGAGGRTVTATTRNVSVSHTFSTDEEFLDWHHYVFVQEDNDVAKLYIDGVLVGSVNNPFTNSSNTGLAGGSYLKQGNVSAEFDDFRSYQRKLTYREVEFLYEGDGAGGRSETVLGRAPIDVAVGSESSSEVQSVLVTVDLPVQSVESQAENLRAAVPVPVEGESVQSQAEASQTDVYVRSVINNGDPITVGDSNSTTLERAVLEFDITGVGTSSSVSLRLEVTDISGVELYDVRRWLSDYPTTKSELENGLTTTDGSVQFVPDVGQVTIDITSMTFDARQAGDQFLRIALMDLPAGTNAYYEIDNGTDPPRLLYIPSISLQPESVESQSELTAFNIPHELEVDSAVSASELEFVGVFSQRLDDLTSAESQGNANYIFPMIVNTSVQVNSAESASNSGTLDVKVPYLILGDSIDFTGVSQAKPEREFPFYGDFDEYDPLVDDHYELGSASGSAFVVLRGEDYGIASFSVVLPAGGQIVVKRGSSTVGTLTASGVIEVSTPIGDSLIELQATGSGTKIASVSYERMPLDPEGVQSISQVEDCFITLNADADDAQAQAEAEGVAVKRAGFYVTGSFETGDDGWTKQSQSAWSRELYSESHDGNYSYRLNVSDTSLPVTDYRVFQYRINTNSQGLSEFRGHLKLDGDFASFGGVEICNQDAEILATFTGNNSPTNQWFEFAIEIPKSATSDSADDYIIKIVSIPNPALTGQYVYFDDFGLRPISHKLEMTGSSSSAVNERVTLGINNIGSVSQDAQSQAEAKAVYFAVPATTDSAESASQADAVSLSRKVDALVDSVVAASEVAAVLLSGDAPLLVDSAESSSQIYMRDITDVQSQSQASNVRLGIVFDAIIKSNQASSEAEAVTLSGDSVLAIDGAQSSSQNEQPLVGMHSNITVDSAQSQSENRSFGVQISIEIDAGEVQLCTPTGESEEVITGVAGVNISKGDMVRLTGEDKFVLASALSFEDAQYSGMAVTDAVAGEPVVVAVSGTIIMGDGLSTNNLYILSTVPGKLKKAVFVNAGEYISVVGMAVSNSRITLGTDFQSLLMTNTNDIPPVGTYIEPVDATLVIEDVVPSASRTNAKEEIVVGDLINRNGFLSEADTINNSSFQGMAVSAAQQDCSYATVGARANVDLGGNLLVKNMVYVVSPRRGKMMPITELDIGDYATIVGIAVSERNIVLGSISKGTLAV